MDHRKKSFSPIGLGFSSSNCSTPNERSLSRAFMKINSMLTGIILGRSVDFSSRSRSSSTSSISTNENHRVNSNVCSTSNRESVKYRSRSCLTPARPNSLVFSNSSKFDSSSSQTSSAGLHRSELEQIESLPDDENESFYSAQSSKISTPMIQSTSLLGNNKHSDNHLMKFISTNDRTKNFFKKNS